MRVWKVSPGPNAAHWDRAVQGNKVFIGWPEMGDLRAFESRDQIVQTLRDVYSLSEDHNPVNNSFSLWAFRNEVQPGDLVIANRGSREIVGIGRITGEYQYQPEGDSEYPNVREVEWLFDQEIRLKEGTFPRKTMAEVSEERLDSIREEFRKKVEKGEEIWNEIFAIHHLNQEDANTEESRNFIDDFHAFVRSRTFFFGRELLTRFIYSLRVKPFLLLSGISGTGKTKIAQLFAEYMSANGEEQSQYKDPVTFEYVVQPFNLRHNRMVVPKLICEQYDEQKLNEGLVISLHFGGNEESALMKKENNGNVRLGFRKRFMEWFSSQVQIGDTIHIQIDDEGSNWEFSKNSFNDKQYVPKQHAFLSVRPDWLDHRGLLGFYNPISENYQVTEMLKIMLRAVRYPEHPFFVILDEMNLAKVEHYFSDFLSCLESRRLDAKGNLQQEAIVLHHERQEEAQGISFVDDDGTIYNIPTSVEIPQNLYFIGTVNIDESTYMFSPKVLDRANVIEINELDFITYRLTTGQKEASRNESVMTYQEKIDFFTNDGYFHNYLYEKYYMSSDHEVADLEHVFPFADRLKEIMVAEGYSFGYRVFDEMFTFIDDVTYYHAFDGSEAFDIMMLQKILPKLHGNRAQIESLLNNLFEFCIDLTVEDERQKGYENAIRENYEGDYSGFRFPRSAQKIQSMYKQLMRTGYCSFIQ